MRSNQRLQRRGGPSQRQEEDPSVYPLPTDTQTLVQANIGKCLNLGLRVERFLLCDPHNWELTQEAKRRQNVLLNFKQGDLPRLISAHQQRWEALLRGCEAQGYAVRRIPRKPASRLAIGLGAASVLETSLTLHRLYGFPVIPGTALKGLARSYAELVDGRREGEDEFDDVFGTQQGNQKRAGGVIFFDAIPSNVNTLKLELDVMNPHYSEYYGGRNIPPADYLSPIPVYFLTVAPGSEFLFAVASRDAALADRAEAWLKGGLTELGVGAKTVAGYGYFER